MLGDSGSEFAVEVHHLTKSFGGPPVVDDLSLSIRAGRIYGFLGPNGSGKTTTIRMLCGLLSPDSGNGTCLGLDIVRQRDQIKKMVGYMAQHFGLYDDLTVVENLYFIARVYGVEPLRDIVDETVERFNLSPFANQTAGTLSGGWKQRLALASCIIHGPRLLLLDEPTAGVDPNARREFWNEIHALADEGITILVSTHNMDEAERCHELAYMFAGKLLAHGSAKEARAKADLKTWVVSGKALGELEAILARTPGIEIVTPFADSLRVSARDSEVLNEAVAPYQRDGRYEWVRGQPTFEDVFVWLMRHHNNSGTT